MEKTNGRVANPRFHTIELYQGRDDYWRVRLNGVLLVDRFMTRGGALVYVNWKLEEAV